MCLLNRHFPTTAANVESQRLSDWEFQLQRIVQLIFPTRKSEFPSTNRTHHNNMADPAAETQHAGDETSETGLRGEDDDSDEFLLDEDSDGDSICTSGDDASSGEDSEE